MMLLQRSSLSVKSGVSRMIVGTVNRSQIKGTYDYHSQSRAIGFQNFIFSENTSLLTTRTTSIINRRTLYTEEALGLQKLETLRLSKMQLYETSKDRYIERLEKYLDENQTQSIFKDDLINLIALAENEHHLDLVERLAISLQSQTGDSSLQDSWGSAVMRLYYKMKQLDRAYKNIHDFDKFGGFFNQRTSYQIMLTMLYNAERYQDVVDLYEISSKKLVPKDSDRERGILSCRQLSVVAFAALVKMNTPESLKVAEGLYARDPENPYLRLRVISLLSSLANNVNQPSVALNLISDAPNKNYVSLRTIKVKSLIMLGRYEDILYLLRESLTDVRRERQVLLKEASDEIEASMDQIEDEKTRADLKSMLEELRENNLIGETSLESIILKPIEQRRVDPSFADSSLSNRNRDGFRTYQNQDGFSQNNQSRPPYRQNYQNRDGGFRSNYREDDGGRRNYHDRDDFRQNNPAGERRRAFRVDQHTFE